MTTTVKSNVKTISLVGAMKQGLIHAHQASALAMDADREIAKMTAPTLADRLAVVRAHALAVQCTVDAVNAYSSVADLDDTPVTTSEARDA